MASHSMGNGMGVVVEKITIYGWVNRVRIASDKEDIIHPIQSKLPTHPLRMTHPMVWTHASSDLCFTAHTSIIIFLWGINLIGAL